MKKIINAPVPTHNWRKPSKALILIAVLLGMLIAPSRAENTKPDGFFAYCTSNQDGTGSCINEETQAELECTIVPGQIIGCKTAKQRTVECVWTSGAVAGQAQFWCDPEAEKTLNDDLNPNSF